MGVARFFGDDFDAFHRLSLEPLSVRFYPIAMLGDNLRFRAIVLTAGAQLFVPGFVGSDFCTPNPSVPDRCRGLRPYDAAPHVLTKWGINVDAVALISLLKGR